jgi:hopanoid C-3 methylase
VCSSSATYLSSRPGEGDEVARQLERRRVRRQYCLETRCDVLLCSEEVFRRWRRLGLNYMFLGTEALDEEGLAAFHSAPPRR